MEKLVKLLNEYEKELNTGLHWRIDEKYGMLWRGLNLMGVDQYLISKHYGFIKWLVENDKINFNFVERVGSGDFIYDMNSPYYNSCTCEDLEEYGDVDRVLMLLAISNNPLDFLISILK